MELFDKEEQAKKYLRSAFNRVCHLTSIDALNWEYNSDSCSTCVRGYTISLVRLHENEAKFRIESKQCLFALTDDRPDQDNPISVLLDYIQKDGPYDHKLLKYNDV